jgi:ABC-type lipoprotein export system ATPase subunit
VVLLDKVTKRYFSRKGDVLALDEATLEIRQGEFLVLRGPSGSGKTTLLLAVGGMLAPTSGRIVVNGADVYALPMRHRSRFRAETIGFVFQMFHLVPYLNVLENVLLHAGNGGREEALALLGRFGLSHRIVHHPSELSAGERQRTAIARALLKRPKVVLADEPTGNLDPENAGEVFKYLSEYQQGGGTVILATHGTDADKFASHLATMRAGRIAEAAAV